MQCKIPIFVVVSPSSFVQLCAVCTRFTTKPSTNTFCRSHNVAIGSSTNACIPIFLVCWECVFPICANWRKTSSKAERKTIICRKPKGWQRTMLRWKNCVSLNKRMGHQCHQKWISDGWKREPYMDLC